MTRGSESEIIERFANTVGRPLHRDLRLLVLEEGAPKRNVFVVRCHATFIEQVDVVSLGLVGTVKKEDVWMLLVDIHHVLARNEEVGDMVLDIDGDLKFALVRTIYS
jgi:hypothetical protein